MVVGLKIVKSARSISQSYSVGILFVSEGRSQIGLKGLVRFHYFTEVRLVTSKTFGWKFCSTRAMTTCLLSEIEE